MLGRTPFPPARCTVSGLSNPRCSPMLEPTTIFAPLLFVRHATHKSEGRADGPKDGPGKRLGAKKTGEEYVIPGNIIFRQRGTQWFPGENCGIGRDHTIFAAQYGYVKYYKDPLRHPKRQYIGVALNRDDTLPYPANAPRRRRLGMLAVPMKQAEPDALTHLHPGEGELIARKAPGTESQIRQVPQIGRRPANVMSKNYMFRRTNWEIGRAAERAGIDTTYKPKRTRMLAKRKQLKVRMAKEKARTKRKPLDKGRAKKKKA